MTTPSSPAVRRVNVLALWHSMLAFLSYVAAAGVLTDVIGPKWAALALVVVGGLNVATGVYVAKALPGAIAETASEGLRALRAR